MLNDDLLGCGCHLFDTLELLLLWMETMERIESHSRSPLCFYDGFDVAAYHDMLYPVCNLVYRRIPDSCLKAMEWIRL